MATITVGVRDAKGNLSKLLKQVRRGAQVVITDRGEPVGKIVPIPKKEMTLEALLKDLEERGIVQSRAKDKIRNLPRPVQMPKDVKVQEMLQEDRDRL